MRKQPIPQTFLPTTKAEMQLLGIKELDVIIVTGDAYIDHPSFGAALIGRFIQSFDMTVGIIAMPDVKKPEDFKRLGKPKHFFGVTSGNVDSMLSLFTAQKKPRSDDPYIPGGKAGCRPQRAVIAYCNAIKLSYKDVPIIIGGVEASLRRIAHYDYWSNTVRQSILLDSKADMLIYGMAERPLKHVVELLQLGDSIETMRDIPGTACALGKNEMLAMQTNKDLPIISLPSYDAVKTSPEKFNEMTRMFYEHQHDTLLQESGTRAVLINKMAEPLASENFDKIYELPFTYKQHPFYKEPIPAYEQIKDSITVVRGCFGGCNFCGLGAHQGKIIQSRSWGSVVREIRTRESIPGFKGLVSDLGGPTANMYGLRCKKPDQSKPCIKRSCLSPNVCSFLETNQSQFIELIDIVADLDCVKHVYVNSGVRMDLALLYPEVIGVIAKKATGGQLSVAPEHMSPPVLKAMNKPQHTGWEKFESIFTQEGRKASKEQYLIPYFIAGHPGSTLQSARDLGEHLKKRSLKVRQVQEFIPIPMTVSCAMYYTGKDPFTGAPVTVSYKLSDTREQKDLIMWWQKQDLSGHELQNAKIHNNRYKR